MSVICICGVCIPWSAIWPLVLFLVKPLYDYFQKLFGGKTQDKPAPPAAKTEPCCQQHALPEPTFVDYKEEEGDSWEGVVSSRPFVIAKFTSEFCEPCKGMQEAYKRDIIGKYPNALYVTVDIDYNCALMTRLGIVGIPHIQIYKNGALQADFKGDNVAELDKIVEKHYT